MNLLNLRKTLLDKGIKPLYQNITNESSNFEKDTCIIGITGSTGKTTTTTIINSYLKQCGYKTIMYSSAEVYSPLSYRHNCIKDIPISSSSELLTIVEEAIQIKADYLILEINDTRIKDDIFKDIIFDYKVLTNINPKHNLDLYSEAEYVKLKQSFMNDETSIKIIGYDGYDKTILDNLLESPNSYLVTTNYIKEIKQIKSKGYCYLTKLNSSLNGLVMDFILDNKEYHLTTKMMFNYNAFNILNVIALLSKMNILKMDLFQRIIKNIIIKGRGEMIPFDGRLAIVTPSISGILEELSLFKQKGLIKRIIIVTGFIGYGYYYYEERYQQKEYQEKLLQSHIETAKILDNYCDYIIYTTQDEACLNSKEELARIQNCYQKTSSLEYISNRSMAIKHAIEIANVGDIILITGRGGRKTMCVGSKELIFFDDCETLINLIRERELDNYE